MLSFLRKFILFALTALLLFLGHRAYAQRRSVDSIKALIKLSAQKGLDKDTNAVKLQIGLAYAYSFVNPDSTQFFSEQSLVLSKRLHYNRGIYISLRRLGLAHFVKGDFIEAYKLYKQSYTLAEQADDKEQMANVLYSLIDVYIAEEDYKEADEYVKKALQLHAVYKNDLFYLKILSVKAELFSNENQPDSALNNLFRILVINKQHRDNSFLGNESHEHVAAYTSNDIGNIYLQQKRGKEAIPYYKSALTYYQRVHDETGLIDTYDYLGRGFYSIGNYDEALVYALKSYEISKTKKMFRSARELSEILYPIYYAKGNYKQAYYFLALNKQYSDSTFKESKVKELGRLEAKNDFDKKQIIDQLAYSKNKEANEKTQARQTRVILITLILLIVAIFFIVTGYLGRQRDRRNNLQLSIKNEEIALQAATLQAQATQLNELNGIKDKLFSIIAHDLRTPLVSFIQMLNAVNDDTVETNEFKEMLPYLLKQVSYTSTMLENLLAWSNNQMDGFEMKKEQFALATLVENNINIFEKQIAEKQITVHDLVARDIMVNTDKNSIDLVLRNLIANAVKFTALTGIITITAERKGNFYQVWVTDTGKGIEPAVLSKLFSYEIHSSMGTANEKGTGLGLKICKEFVERNGGEIWATSQLNKGSAFGFSIPIS